MELKFTNFESFLLAVKSITHESLEKAKKILFNEGKNIESIEDIFVNQNDELFELLPDGTLTRVNLYIAIKSVDKYFFDINNININDLYKYHIYQCQTITKMFNSGRKHRYKINNRTNGTFHYTFNDFQGNTLKIDENQKLSICKNCLAKFYENKRVSDSDVKNFKLEKFYQKSEGFFNKLNTFDLEKGEYAKADVYSRFWNQISNQVRIKRNYTCEECGYKPRNDFEKKYIHTHHVNGDKQNNKEENLKVLCIKCHADVDRFHHRIKLSNMYKTFINK